MGFNSGFKGLNLLSIFVFRSWYCSLTQENAVDLHSMFKSPITLAMTVGGKTYRYCQTRVFVSLHDVSVVDKRLVEQQLIISHTILQLR